MPDSVTHHPSDFLALVRVHLFDADHLQHLVENLSGSVLLPGCLGRALNR